ncbi:hypothetical protein [Photorhabdus sp. RW14-46]|uniref:hypothetical protein n=1 Tax=Photorhabdus sp. RW14-46 TaxID=2100168 RepID=UPI0013F493DB|nr:hypothetical protein [Photorhabdus sp. RW14-46]
MGTVVDHYKQPIFSKSAPLPLELGKSKPDFPKSTLLSERVSVHDNRDPHLVGSEKSTTLIHWNKNHEIEKF